MASRRNRIKIPFVGNINLKSPKTWMLFGGVALAGLAYLAYSGRNTGVQFIDSAADQFEGLYEDYLGPFPNMPPGSKPPMKAAPVVPSASAASRGMTFDDMVFSGAYATDSALPYTDWWNNDISDDDRIIVA